MVEIIDDSLIFEVFDLITKQSIGFIKSKTYELAQEEAFKRYQRPVDICFHDLYTIQLRRNLK